MKLGLLLPGQGAQTVGMGFDFAQRSSAAAALFERADQVLGMQLSNTCFEGPPERLTRTDIAQPAIYVCSLAALAAFEQEVSSIQPIMAAGLSLGEYTALAATKAISFEDGLELVRLRGQAMQAASEEKPSGMTSVLGLEPAILEVICAKVATQTHLICQVANLNSPGQVVVSGETGALDILEPRAVEAGAKGAIRLTVAGAFHSEVMRPAAEKLEAALNSTEFRKPICPVWQNATAVASTDPDELKTHLAAQLTSPVRWEESYRAMANQIGEHSFLEPAPGRVLAGLARKIVRGPTIHSLNRAEALDTLKAKLSPA